MMLKSLMGMGRALCACALPVLGLLAGCMEYAPPLAPDYGQPRLPTARLHPYDTEEYDVFEMSASDDMRRMVFRDRMDVQFSNFKQSVNTFLYLDFETGLAVRYIPGGNIFPTLPTASLSPSGRTLALILGRTNRVPRAVGLIDTETGTSRYIYYADPQEVFEGGLLLSDEFFLFGSKTYVLPDNAPPDTPPPNQPEFRPYPYEDFRGLDPLPYASFGGGAALLNLNTLEAWELKGCSRPFYSHIINFSTPQIHGASFVASFTNVMEVLRDAYGATSQFGRVWNIYERRMPFGGALHLRETGAPAGAPLCIDEIEVVEDSSLVGYETETGKPITQIYGTRQLRLTGGEPFWILDTLDQAGFHKADVRIVAHKIIDGALLALSRTPDNVFQRILCDGPEPRDAPSCRALGAPLIYDGTEEKILEIKD